MPRGIPGGILREIPGGIPGGFPEGHLFRPSPTPLSDRPCTERPGIPMGIAFGGSRLVGRTPARLYQGEGETGGGGRARARTGAVIPGRRRRHRREETGAPSVGRARRFGPWRRQDAASARRAREGGRGAGAGRGWRETVADEGAGRGRVRPWTWRVAAARGFTDTDLVRARVGLRWDLGRRG